MDPIIACTRCGGRWTEATVPRAVQECGTANEHRIECCDTCHTGAHLVDLDAAGRPWGEQPPGPLDD